MRRCGAPPGRAQRKVKRDWSVAQQQTGSIRIEGAVALLPGGARGCRGSMRWRVHKVRPRRDSPGAGQRQLQRRRVEDLIENARYLEDSVIVYAAQMRAKLAEPLTQFLYSR